MIEITRGRGGRIRINSTDNGDNTYTYKVFYDQTLLISKQRQTDEIGENFLADLKNAAERVLNKLSLEPKPEYMRGLRFRDENLVFYISNNLKNAEGLHDADLVELRRLYLDQSEPDDLIGTSNEDFAKFIKWLEHDRGFYFLQELSEVFVVGQPAQDYYEPRLIEASSAAQ